MHKNPTSLFDCHIRVTGEKFDLLPSLQERFPRSVLLTLPLQQRDLDPMNGLKYKKSPEQLLRVHNHYSIVADCPMTPDILF